MANNQPPIRSAKPFTGTAAQMRNSPWLASEDIASLGGEKDLVIEGVALHDVVQFAQGREKNDVFSIGFVGVKRRLIVNGTIRKSLIRMFGIHTKDWHGKTVCLYVTDNTARIGEKKCIRVREASAPPSTKTTEQLEAEAADRAAEQR